MHCMTRISQQEYRGILELFRILQIFDKYANSFLIVTKLYNNFELSTYNVTNRNKIVLDKEEKDEI